MVSFYGILFPYLNIWYELNAMSTRENFPLFLSLSLSLSLSLTLFLFLGGAFSLKQKGPTITVCSFFQPTISVWMVHFSYNSYNLTIFTILT